MQPKYIELLSPAKNAETGIEAIRHGADAVFIGAPQFSARSAAGNSIEEIAELVEFAHLYHARVYVAFNTILTDEQLPEAQAMITELYNIGVDALIVQDMGILELDIPPIALHASTQADNRTSEKVEFLSSAGFSQVVLARELGLPQIKAISDKVDVPLEVFVHGALCVSYSGQCYISQAYAGRSANRGDCSQFCRLPYRLEDSTGKVMSRNSHILSLKDMNRSDSLEELLDAGVTSFKIEGRLKEISYVKNVTMNYRKKLDEIFARRPEYKRLSSGTTRAMFTPAPGRTFNRGFTNYYVDRKTQAPQQLWNYDSPKAMGEPVGTVKAIFGNYFTVAGTVQLHNGDGLCFMNEQGELTGFRVNRVEENKVFPAEMPKLTHKTELFRNWDQEFEKLLSKPSADRRIDVSIELAEAPNGFVLSFTDENEFRAESLFELEKQTAQTPQKENITKQLSKLGNTIFKAKEVNITFDSEWFIPASQLAEWRRILVEKLLAVRKAGYKRDLRKVVDPEKQLPYPEKKLTYLGNVANSKAELFYRKHEVTEIAPAFELKPEKNVPLMFTKHCVKYSLKICPVHQTKSEEFKEPFYIHNDGLRFRLEFDCKNCQMLVFGD